MDLLRRRNLTALCVDALLQGARPAGRGVLSPADALRVYESALPVGGHIDAALTRSALRALHDTLRAALPELDGAAHHALLAVHVHGDDADLHERLERYEQDARTLGATRVDVAGMLADLHARQPQG